MCECQGCVGKPRIEMFTCDCLKKVSGQRVGNPSVRHCGVYSRGGS